MATDLNQLLTTIAGLTGADKSSQDYAAQNQQIQSNDQILQINRMKIADAQQAQADDQQFQQDLGAFNAAPTPDGLWRLAAAHPDKAKGLVDANKMKDDAQAAADFHTGAQIYSAALSNSPELVKRLITDRRDAEKQAGLPTDDLDGLLTEFDTDPKSALTMAKSTALGVMYSHNPEQYAKAFNIGDKGDEWISVGDGTIVNKRTAEARNVGGPKIEWHKDANQVEHPFAIDRGAGAVSPGGDGTSPTGSGGGGDDVDNYFRGVVAAEGGTNSDGSFRTSRRGAIGPAQLMPATIPEAAQLAGVDPELVKTDTAANLAAGRAYFQKQLSDFGNPALAAAAYNAGPGNVRDAIKNGKSGWLQRLPAETQAYVPKVMVAARGGGSAATQGGGAPFGPGIRQLDTTPWATTADALLTPEELKYYSESVANGGDLPTLGMGKDAAKVRRQILAQAADININRNIGGTQGNLLKADLKANTRSLGDLTKLRTNVEASERTASLNMDQVLKLAPKGVAGGVPLFNKWIQAGRRAIPGDADLAALDTAMTTAANEYAAVMTRQAGSGAPTSDTARAEAHGLLHSAQNLGAISSTIRQMKIDMANRKHSLSEQDQILRGNIMAGAGSAIPRGAGGGAALPPGIPAGAQRGGKTPDGRQIYVVNGQKFVAQ